MKINQIAVNYKHSALNIGNTLNIEVRNVYTMFTQCLVTQNYIIHVLRLSGSYAELSPRRSGFVSQSLNNYLNFLVTFGKTSQLGLKIETLVVSSAVPEVSLYASLTC